MKIEKGLYASPGGAGKAQVMYHDRKLLEGEVVEVRQKEVGLRGSWHSGVVVQVKHGRRVIEYDHLLTLDGTKHLRESIPLPECIKHQFPVRQGERNGMAGNQNMRGFIRPKPPDCLQPSPQTWTQGLLVDAFYDDAWWEGILLDGVVCGKECDAKVRIFFPEEGDELHIMLKHVRISQDWDEISGLWGIRGHWSLSSENGKVDVGPLKRMCTHRRSLLKRHWRQRNICQVQEPEEGEDTSASLLQNQSQSAGVFVADTKVSLGCRCTDKDMVGLTVEHPNDVTGNLGCLASEYVATSSQDTTVLKVDQEYYRLSNRDEILMPVSSGSSAVLLPIAQGHTFVKSDLSSENAQAALTEPSQEHLPHSAGLVSLTPSAVSDGENLASPRKCSVFAAEGPTIVQPSEDSAQLVDQCEQVKTLTKGAMKSLKGGGKTPPHLVVQSTIPLEQDTGLLENIVGTTASHDGTLETTNRKIDCNGSSGTIIRQKIRTPSTTKLAGNAYEAASIRQKDCKPSCRVTRSTSALILDQSDGRHRCAALSQEECDKPDATKCNSASASGTHGRGSQRFRKLDGKGRPDVQGTDPPKSEGFFSAASMQAKELRQAYPSAKEMLLDAGWTMGRQGCHHGTAYISPTGFRYRSLASACRHWKNQKNQSSPLKVSSTERLFSNSLVGDDCVSRQMKSEQVMKPALLTGQSEPKTSKIVVHPEDAGKLITAPQSVEDVNDTCQLQEIFGIREQGKVEKANCQTLITSNAKHNVRSKGGGFTEYHNENCDIRQQEGIQRANCEATDASNAAHDLRSKNTPTLFQTENLKKRKCDREGSPLQEEMRRKRGRAPLKKASLLQGSKSHRVRGGCRMQVLLSPPRREKDSGSGHDSGGSSHFKRSTVLSWLIDKGLLKERESVRYLNRKDGHVMKQGQVTREGVLCKCCGQIFTLSNFEAHAGSRLHRPSANTFLDDGRSISDCQLQACDVQEITEKREGFADTSDDICGVCGDGGELILCDHCPSTYHRDCVGLEVIPEGDWYCPRCSCAVCGMNQLDGIASESTLQCSQCELAYHISCVRAHAMLDSNHAAKIPWFCCEQCEKIFTGLRGLIGKAHPLECGFSYMLLQSMKHERGATMSSIEAMAEHTIKLSVAHGVMQECFVPMIDPRTKVDLISQALYSRRSIFTRLDFGGFYTLILEVGDEIISVATIRVHGAKLAEMPLIGTRYQYRRQGMCRRLMHALEKMLATLGVEKLILPAVPELLDTWTGAFHFQVMSSSEVKELSKLNLVSFPGTTLVQKHLLIESFAQKLVSQSRVTEDAQLLEKSSFESVEFIPTPAGAICAEKICNMKTIESPSINTILVEKQCFLDNVSHALGFDQVQGATELFPPESQQTAVGLFSKEGYAGACSNREMNANQKKCKLRSDNESKKVEDAYNTKVIITTTRSKRQVKSSKWVADGLKKLVKDTRQSKLLRLSLSESPPQQQSDSLLDISVGTNHGCGMKNMCTRASMKENPAAIKADRGQKLENVSQFSDNLGVSKLIDEPHDTGCLAYPLKTTEAAVAVTDCTLAHQLDNIDLAGSPHQLQCDSLLDVSVGTNDGFGMKNKCSGTSREEEPMVVEADGGQKSEKISQFSTNLGVSKLIGGPHDIGCIEYPSKTTGPAVAVTDCTLAQDGDNIYPADRGCDLSFQDCSDFTDRSDCQPTCNKEGYLSMDSYNAALLNAKVHSRCKKGEKLEEKDREMSTEDYELSAKDFPQYAQLPMGMEVKT